MKKLTVTFALVLCALQLCAQNNFENKQPKLVVNIIVDGIQTNHIATLWNYLDEGGLKRIFKNGALYSNLCYNYYAGGVSSDLATLATGSTPSKHGVIGDNYFQQKTKETLSIVSDERYSGIATQDGNSPYNLYASTLSDELKLATNGAAKVFAIAPNAEEAIVLGGHAADAAIWIDNQFGKLATSSYYNLGLPAWCNAINSNGIIEQYTNFSWTPLFAPFTYNFPANGETKKNKPFEYSAANYTTSSEAIKAFKQTPSLNKLMRRLAIRAIVDEKLGQDNNCDLLQVKFTLNPPINTAHELISSEKEDMYLRLDKEIKLLLDSIDSTVGLKNTLIALCGTQCINLHPATLTLHKINAGTFNAKRAMALLNHYLMILHGQGEWVMGYYARNIYLNERLAEKKGVDFRLITYQAQRFMTDFQGVQAVYNTNELQHIAGANDETAKVKHSIHPKLSGAIYFTLLPGWIEVGTDNTPIGISGRSMLSSPLLLFGWDITPQEIDTQVYPQDLAPTIAKMLRIPYPNACEGKPLPLGK